MEEKKILKKRGFLITAVFFIIIIIISVRVIQKKQIENIDITNIPDISNSFNNPSFGYIDTFDNFTIYLGYDKSTNWKMNIVKGVKTSWGYFSFINEEENIKIDISLLTSIDLFENEKYYIYKRDLDINGYKGALYINRNGEANFFLTLDSTPNELYLYGKIRTNDDLIIDSQTIVASLDEIKFDSSILESSNIESILKTLTYKSNGKIKNDNNRYLKQGNLIVEEYNIYLINSRNSSKNTNTNNLKKDSPRVVLLNDHVSQEYKIIIENGKKFIIHYIDGKKAAYAARYSTNETFEPFISKAVRCVGNVIDEETFANYLMYFKYNNRLYNNEYNNNIINSYLEESSVKDIKTYLYIDNNQHRFYHIFCLDEENGIYLMFYCYGSNNNPYDFRTYYNYKEYQDLIKNIEINYFSYYDNDFFRFVNQ